MNIERLYPIWFVLCALAGATIGSMTGHGAIRGLTGGMIIASMPLFLLGLAYFLMMLWRPDLPVCRCGQCNYKDYVFDGSTDGIEAGGSVKFKCPRCGRVYVLSCDRFHELADDGSTIPYMHHKKWGRWKETTAKQTPEGDIAKRAALLATNEEDR